MLNEKKKEYLATLKRVNDLISKYPNLNSLMQENQNLIKKITDFEVLVPIVGGFNTGKSSLLNKYANQEIFPTDIVPQTAIAAELRYSKEERILAYDNLDNEVLFNLKDISSISPKEYKYIKVFKDIDILRELDDIVLVDMPGLDSDISNHNKAILNYIKEGVYYVLVSDIDYGIKGSVLNFLSEINMYSLDFSVILSKKDHKTKEDIEEVIKYSKNLLASYKGEEVFVGATSVVDNDIDDFIYIINNIDVIKAFETKTKDDVIIHLNNLIESLIRTKEFQSVDFKDIDNTIRDLNKEIRKQMDSLDNESKKIESEFEEGVKENILKDVKVALNSNISRLVQSAKSGQDAFVETVNEIIRPILTKSTNENVDLVLQESYRNLNNDFEKVFDILQKCSGSLIDNKDSIIDILTKDNKVDSITRMSRKSLVGYKALIGVLGITTSVIAPWLEVIILFLPEALGVLRGVMSNFYDEKIQNQLQLDIIPSIISKLRVNLSDGLQTIKMEFISKIEEEFEIKKQQLIESLNSAKEKRDKKQADFDNYINGLNSDINELKNMIKDF